MSSWLSDREHEVLELLDHHPQGLDVEQIVRHLQNDVVTELQKLLKKGFLERTRDGRIRTLGRLFSEDDDDS